MKYLKKHSLHLYVRQKISCPLRKNFYNAQQELSKVKEKLHNVIALRSLEEFSSQ